MGGSALSSWRRLINKGVFSAERGVVGVQLAVCGQYQDRAGICE
jgi:hypothetical protein